MMTFLLITAMANANSVFFDSNGNFSLHVPSGWVYHAFESRSDLVVFYGPGDGQVLYIESFKDILNKSPYAFAERIVDLFNSNYGLTDFDLLLAPQERNLRDLTIVEIIYSFLGTKPRIEHRIFAVHQNWGLTITYSDSFDDYHNNSNEFELILSEWMWLEEDNK